MGLNLKSEDNPQQPQQCSRLLISSRQHFQPMITPTILKIISISFVTQQSPSFDVQDIQCLEIVVDVLPTK